MLEKREVSSILSAHNDKLDIRDNLKAVYCPFLLDMTCKNSHLFPIYLWWIRWQI